MSPHPWPSEELVGPVPEYTSEWKLLDLVVIL